MRFLPISLSLSLFLVSLLLPGTSHAESVKILVQSSPLAGSQYYAVNSVWQEIQLGNRLTLIREPQNRHDRNAVRVEWQGRQLGYVPRAENRAVARAMDSGEQLEGRVSRLREDSNPWLRVEFEVYLIL
ncbi:MAG: HIRAN domain-containing protein [Betaproteobacteria bacterium]